VESTGSGSASASAPDSSNPPYWIFLPGIAAAILVVAHSLRSHVISGEDSLRMALAVGSFVSPWLLGLVCRLFRSRLAFLWAGVVVALYWAIAVYCVYGLMYLFLFLPPALAMAVASSISLVRHPHPWSAWGALGTWGVLSIWALGIVVVKNRPMGPDPTAAAPMLMKVARCTHEFRTARPELGYPASLEQVGPSGTRCLSDDEAGLRDPSDGYVIDYVPGRSADGRITSYLVTGDERSPDSEHWSSYSMDESGLMKYGWAGARLARTTHLYFPLGRNPDMLVDCLSRKLGTSSPGEAEAYLRDQCLQYAGTYGDTGSLRAQGHMVHYTFHVDPNGRIEGFDVTVRPITYGVSGVRSYLIVVRKPAGHERALHVHVTAENRPADTSDPSPRDCEIHSDDCPAEGS